MTRSSFQPYFLDFGHPQKHFHLFERFPGSEFPLNFAMPCLDTILNFCLCFSLSIAFLLLIAILRKASNQQSYFEHRGFFHSTQRLKALLNEPQFLNFTNFEPMYECFKFQVLNYRDCLWLQTLRKVWRQGFRHLSLCWWLSSVSLFFHINMSTKVAKEVIN